MKNIKKRGKRIISFCLSLIILLTVCIMPVNATEAPSSITVKRTSVMESYIGDNNGFTAYATTDGVIVYCMELIKKGATTGTNYSFLENADAGLLYIIENGYPNKTITNRDEIDRYITQSAVWWYLDETSGAGNLSTAFQTTDREAYPGIRDTDNTIEKIGVEKSKKLVNDAKTAKAEATPSMDVTLNDGSLKLTADSKYYESDYVTVSLTGASEYKVSTDNNNATSINENGEEASTFKAGEKFKIRIPADSVKDEINMTATITATASTKYVATFKPENSEFQKVVSSQVYNKDVNLENTLTLSGSPQEAIVVEVPDTSSNVSLFVLIAGTLLVIVGAGLIVYRYRLNRN